MVGLALSLSRSMAAATAAGGRGGRRGRWLRGRCAGGRLPHACLRPAWQERAKRAVEAGGSGEQQPLAIAVVIMARKIIRLRVGCAQPAGGGGVAKPRLVCALAAWHHD